MFKHPECLLSQLQLGGCNTFYGGLGARSKRQRAAGGVIVKEVCSGILVPLFLFVKEDSDSAGGLP